jgi:predicted DNA-binding WGR domain protein
MAHNRRRIYLELANDVLGELAPWKFYEVRVEDQSVTFRWGRIGCLGRSITQHFSSLAAARAAAARKVRQKRRRGYRGAIEGIRPPRPARQRPLSPPDQRQLALNPPGPGPPRPCPPAWSPPTSTLLIYAPLATFLTPRCSPSR